MGDAVKVVTCTPDELRALIRDAVREELAANTQQNAEYLTRRQVAELLGCTTASVSNWTRDHGLPVVRAGGTVRYPRAQVLAWLEGRKLRAVK